jgi:hypothetical protein
MRCCLLFCLHFKQGNIPEYELREIIKQLEAELRYYRLYFVPNLLDIDRNADRRQSSLLKKEIEHLMISQDEISLKFQQRLQEVEVKFGATVIKLLGSKSKAISQARMPNFRRARIACYY